jgi:hypothetical protein
VKRLLRKCFSTRKASVLSVAVIALVFASVGLGAWLYFQGVYGNGQAKFATPQNGGSAIQFSDGVAGVADLAPGNPGTLTSDIFNNDPNVAHTIATINSGAVTFVTSPNASCASYLSLNGSALVGYTLAAGASSLGQAFPGAVVAAPSTPLTCGGNSVDVSNITGTTSP